MTFENLIHKPGEHYAEIKGQKTDVDVVAAMLKLPLFDIPVYASPLIGSPNAIFQGTELGVVVSDEAFVPLAVQAIAEATSEEIRIAKRTCDEPLAYFETLPITLLRNDDGRYRISQRGYVMRASDAPAELTRIKEALETIARKNAE